VLLAYRCALASPRVSAAGVEATEFAVAADRLGVVSVPAIVVDDRIAWLGNVPEPVFVERLLRAAHAGA
jgi:predicted DsbA family dithiol-disulfide isomerase